MRTLLLIAFLSRALWSETLTDRSLNGRYHFVHLIVSATATGHIAGVRNVGGAMTFSGDGRYTLSAKRATDSSDEVPVGWEGTYAVASDGRVRISYPEATVNARLGAGGGMLLGSSTEFPGLTDIFVAVPAAEGASASLLQHRYAIGTLTFRAASPEAFSTSFTELTADGQGTISARLRTHERRNEDNDVKGVTKLVEASGAYTVGEEGAGKISVGESASDLFVSRDGDLLLGFSNQGEKHEISVGIRTGSGSMDGNFWLADLLVDTEIAGATRVISSVGAAKGSDTGQLHVSQRLNAGEKWRNLTAVNVYQAGGDGWGQLGPVFDAGRINFAVGRNGFVAVQVGAPDTIVHLHGLMIAFRMPTPTGDGLFLSPHGVSPVAADLPPTTRVSAGTEVLLRGSGFAERDIEAGASWPTELGGVRVTVNGTAAALAAVGREQIRLQIPAEVRGGLAEFVVHKGTSQSNNVTVEVATSAPLVIAQSEALGVPPLQPVGSGEEFTLLASGIDEASPLTAFVAGRAARVLSVSAGPRPGVLRVRVQAPPGLPSGGSAALALAAGDGFTCLANVPMKSR